MPSIRTNFVDSSTIALTFEVGAKTKEGKIIAFKQQTGDVISSDRTVEREGKAIGVLVGKDNSLIHEYDAFKSDPAVAFFKAVNSVAPADKEANYKITVGGQTYTPTEVFRKSTILESSWDGSWPPNFVEEHTIHIKLKQPLKTGEKVSVDFQTPLLSDTSVTFSPATIRSEAVHVSQIGFDTKDPVKVAFLSSWLGDNQGVDNEKQGVTYAAGTKFHVVNSQTGAKVYSGTIELSQAANNPSNFSENFSKTDIYKMDFSSVTAAGKYHVLVDGVGKSYDFAIGNNPWQDAFEISARGMYHQRSGIEHKAEYSEFTKPRDLHPDDGVKIYQSKATLMDTDMGLNLKNQISFSALVAGKTDQLVKVAGGWHDAADFDRRAQHLESVNDLLFIAETQPNLVKSTKLNLPESKNNIPDLIDEALWGLDFFKALQRADGAVSGGIESSEHPKTGETSWTESLDVFAYAPDAWSSYKFAASAAKAYALVKPYDSARADGYLSAAIKAMNWASANTPAYAANNIEVKISKNLAAAELYKATADEKWNKVYLSTTVYGNDPLIEWNEHMIEAAHVYGTTKHAGVNKAVQKLGLDDIVSEADAVLKNANDDGFMTPVNPFAPITFTGLITNPTYAAKAFTRAHHITQDAKWHSAMVGAAQFMLGANPTNMSYITGIGQNAPREIMDFEASGVGQGPRPGITIYGLWNPREGNQWWTGPVNDVMPMQWQAPVNETFIGWDAIAPLGEYTVMQGITPSTVLLGYLAGLAKGGGGTVDPDPSTKPTVGNDTLVGTAARDVINALAGNDLVKAAAGNDLLQGADGNDVLLGEAGDDYLAGGFGDDRLEGGDGKDMLYGGRGVDSILGGAGADRIVYTARDEVGDKIFGFDSDDLIVLKGSSFGDLAKGALATGKFAFDAPKDADDHIVFKQADDTLWFDADGNGSTKAIMIADFQTDVRLTAADIMIV
jgi:endoglucanase